MTCDGDCKHCMYGRRDIKKGVCKVNHSITCSGNCNYCNFFEIIEATYNCTCVWDKNRVRERRESEWD